MSTQSETKTHTILLDDKVFIPWNSGYGRLERKMDITYDPEKTKMLSAQAYMRSTVSGWCYLTSQIKMNGNLLLDHTTGEMQEKTVDVSTLIFNGVNLFSAEVWKGAPPCYYAGEGTFTFLLTITYEGTAPAVGPSKGITFLSIPWYVWAAIAILGIGTIVTIAPALRKPKVQPPPVTPPIIVVR